MARLLHALRDEAEGLLRDPAHVADQGLAADVRPRHLQLPSCHYAITMLSLGYHVSCYPPHHVIPGHGVVIPDTQPEPLTHPVQVDEVNTN